MSGEEGGQTGASGEEGDSHRLRMLKRIAQAVAEAVLTIHWLFPQDIAGVNMGIAARCYWSFPLSHPRMCRSI